VTALAGLLGLGAAAWLWYHTLRRREIAIRAARRYCADHDYQLLDATVALAGWRPCREGGRWRQCRVYQFEYTTDGHDRRQGRLGLRGDRLAWVNLVLH